MLSRVSRPTALAAVLVAPLLALSLTGCGGTDGESTAAVSTTGATTATTAPATVDTSSPSAPAGPLELPDQAAALAEAFSAADYGVVWDLACPGARQNASRDEFATTMSAVLTVELANPTVLDEGLTDEARADLRDPGTAYDDEALVRFDVGPGSNYPNPTMTAWFVNTDTGWLYCGMVPDA
ncbi:MAG TPA: hypothetical protein VLC50_02545 [Actinomycetes bacterium]|nr:hypothetical protein [Actinomycetes bacterium]